MSFVQQNTLSTLTSHFNERQWVEQIRQTLDEEFVGETETSVTIFGVAKPLTLINPECYIPQQVAIGPYHHFRPELYDMERYKIAAAKRSQKELENLKFEDIVDSLIESDLQVRANYHRPVSIGPEALAWMMAVDGSFLFEFFQVCCVSKGKFWTKDESTKAHFLALSRNKTVNNVILRDVFMLENQIPLFVMRTLLKFQFSSMDFADHVLLDMLTEISDELSPFKMVDDGSKKIEMKECAHILDFLYRFVVPQEEVKASQRIENHHEEEEEEENAEKMENEKKKESVPMPSHLRQILEKVWRILSNLKPSERVKKILFSKPLKVIKKIIFSKPVKVLMKLPWSVLTKIPIIRVIKEPVENIFRTFQDDTDKKDEDDSSPDNVQKPALLEEIEIPSVSELVEVGIHFVPTNGGISSIKFDKKTLTVYLPVIELDENSEVLLRNLVAYEACSVTRPLILGRYTEMMNGIVDTDEDAKILCQNRIILNRLKNEQEVTDLWNGMSKSIRLTKVPTLDKVIGDVNKYYNKKWSVKFQKFMKDKVFGSWRILTFLAAILLLLLTTLQAFCEVYNCSSILPIKGLEPANPEQ